LLSHHLEAAARRRTQKHRGGKPIPCGGKPDCDGGTYRVADHADAAGVDTRDAVQRIKGVQRVARFFVKAGAQILSR
jgi:hypothetical protein